MFKNQPSQANLPVPSAEAKAHSDALIAHIASEIRQAGGWIDFAAYMSLALYAPALGYYSAGAKKFGEAGDFITAPEFSPLFTQTLAEQICELQQHLHGDILELGAGSGRLALHMLESLPESQLPKHYYILEVSAYLREVQRETLQSKLNSSVFSRVVWLDSLPDKFKGIVLGNEVLDALPVHMLQQHVGCLHTLGVALADQSGDAQATHASPFVWKREEGVSEEVAQLLDGIAFPEGYTTECCPAAVGLLQSLADMLEEGVVLFIDYGFNRREYYHPQREQGTLMCHYRHHAHPDPFYLPGLQDITAHVDFGAIATAGEQAGFNLLGYATQAQFLINCGITDILSRVSPHDVTQFAPLASQAQKLLSPAEMGDLFKVIAMGKAYPHPLKGFKQGDKSHTL